MKTCLECGNEIKRMPHVSFSMYEKQEYCSTECRKKSMQRSPLYSELFNSLILTEKDTQRPELSEEDLYEVVSYNCAYFRLFYLYSLLEPYSTDGVKLEDRLLNTQIYLLDILRRIKNLEQLLDIIHRKKRKNYNYEKGNWNTGPTDQELRKIERER